MSAKIVNEVQLIPGNWQEQEGDDSIACSVGTMARNEGVNSGRTIRAVLQQESLSMHIEEVIVVANDCTDNMWSRDEGLDRKGYNG